MYYVFTCSYCGWRGERYRNLHLCPTCREPVEREGPTILKLVIRRMVDPGQATVGITLDGHRLTEVQIPYCTERSSIGLALILAAQTVMTSTEETDNAEQS